MFKFLKDTKAVLMAQVIILGILLVFGAFAVYIIVDGGDLQSILENVKFIGSISIIGAYMGLSSIWTSLMAYKQATFEVEDEEQVKVLQDENATLNNKISIQKANKFFKFYNKEKLKEKQEESNEQLKRKLTAKIYKMEDQPKIDTLKAKLKSTKSKFKKFILKIRIMLNSKSEKYKKLLNKLEKGRLNAKVSNYKPTKRHEVTSVQVETTRDKQDMKLKSNLKRKTFAKSFIKALFTNFIYSFGLVLALQGLFDYNFKERWIGLAVFLLFYILSLCLQYLVYYISTKKNYKPEVLEILNNRKALLTQCDNYEQD